MVADMQKKKLQNKSRIHKKENIKYTTSIFNVSTFLTSHILYGSVIYIFVILYIDNDGSKFSPLAKIFRETRFYF